MLNYKLNNNIFFLGYQRNIGGLLRSCDVFTHPCYSEAFGIVIAEAMLAKKPIIVSNAGALPELIENNKTGLTVDASNPDAWADSVQKLIANSKLCEQLSQSAYEKAKHSFSIDLFVSNYRKLYQSVLND